jgi:signal transduction histidine kinase
MVLHAVACHALRPAWTGSKVMNRFSQSLLANPDGEAYMPPPRRRWIFPLFWVLVFWTGIALSILSLHARHPEWLHGWRAAGLGALLLGTFAMYMLLAWGWLYRPKKMNARPGLLVFGVEMLLLALLVWWYGGSFAWISLALLYPLIGGLPMRYWPLPVAALLLVFALGTLPADATPGALAAFILNTILLLAVNAGIAVGLRVLVSRSDQLRSALAQLRQAHAELAASAAQREELAVLRERARLARALHDNIGHALVVMNVKLEAAQLLYARDPARGDAELEATRALIRDTMADLRRALADLRAPLAAPDDLPDALRRLAHEVQARAGIAVMCDVAPDLPAPPADVCEAIWYVAREALANVEQHAAATHAAIALEQVADNWLLRVADDGVGVRPDDLRRPAHYGVVGMQERMKAIGGTCAIQRGPDGGTIVEARAPAHAAQEIRSP